VQLALVGLLHAWGITPTAVTGHSTGEIAAAFTAGALDLREAVIASYYRGLINSQHIDPSAAGAMMAVGLGASEVGPYLQDVTAGRVTVACHNSPSSVTLSGDSEAVSELEKTLTENGVFARKLRVQAAFHSHHMLPLQDAYRSALTRGFRRHVKREFAHGVLFYSPVSGEIVNDANQLGPQHWVDNMLEPVRFAESFRNMVFTESTKSQKIDTVVEIGPHSALAGPIRQCLSDSMLKGLGVTYGSCLERGKHAVQTMQTLAGLLWQRGCHLEFAQVNFEQGLGLVRAMPGLPSYPWNHSKSYWIEPRSSHEHRMRPYPPHPLLGVKIPGMSSDSPVWRLVLRAEELPWMRDHVVQSEMVYPAAGYVAMAIEAMRQLHNAEDKCISGYLIRDLQIEKALRVPDDSEGTEVQLYIESSDEASLVKDWRKFRIYATSMQEGGWDSIAHGTIAVELDEGQAKTSVLRSTAALTDAGNKYHREMKPQDLFESLGSIGISHGPLFRNLTNIRLSNSRSAATLLIPDTAATIPHRYEQEHVIHPITLDGVFQSFYCTLSSEAFKMVGASVPRSIKSLFVSSRIMEKGAGQRLNVLSRLLDHNRQGFVVAAAVTPDDAGDESLRALVEIEDMHFQSLGRSDSAESQTDDDQVCVICEWERSPTLNDLSPVAPSLKQEASMEEIEMTKDLARVTYHFVHDVLGQLTEKDVAGLEWYHKRFYEWMRQFEQKASRNELAPRSERWAKISEGSKYMLIDKVEKASIHGQLAVRIGKNLLGIMRKTIAPLELMLEGKLLYEFYQHFLNFPQSALQAGQAVRALAAENPRARILEIGGGTAGCTWPVLQALKEGNDVLFEHYDFTDVSVGFFAAAKERLSSWGDLISYSALDIEKDPEEQGFKPGSYDIIVAAQVLHATKNLNATLKNARKLLAENGKMVLVETTQDMPEVHLIFGTLPGWWLSEEPERKYSPNLPLKSWDGYLKDAGFSGLDRNVWDHHTMSCIMTTVANSRQPEVEEAPVIVYVDEVPPIAWTKEFMGRIQACCQGEPVLAKLGSFDATGKTCILLSGISGGAQIFDETNFSAIKNLVTQAKALLWVTAGSSVDCENPENALHLGLLRTARLEDTRRVYVSLDLDPSRDPWSRVASEAITRVLQATLYNQEKTSTFGLEYAERSGEILIPRLHNDALEDEGLQIVEPEPTMQPFVQSGRNLRMHVDAPGLLDSIVFKDNTEWKQEEQVPDGWVEIQPRVFGLNFKDVMLAMGMLKQKQELGLECAGIATRVGRGVERAHVQEGDRVCAFTGHGHFGNRVRVPWTSVARLPDTMTFETGASFVLPFITAYYSLFNSGHCEVGDKVLVHSASGGVGQACINLLQWKGIEVFATAGTTEKRDFLATTYGIPPDHILSSRDSSFADAVLDATDGKGVDVVINSLGGKLLDASWHVLAQHGRFVEIGKRDIHMNKSLRMEPFQKALSFIHVDVVQLADTKGPIIQRILREVVGLLTNRNIRGISPVTPFAISDAGRALRMMQTGSHIGKLVLVAGTDDMVKASNQSCPIFHKKQRNFANCNGSRPCSHPLPSLCRRTVPTWLSVG
jgi:NADPH:quinone reductase-like Zn-dependent oxidoreductase/malonyl CoA-acyl carrier protein transacylase